MGWSEVPASFWMPAMSLAQLGAGAGLAAVFPRGL